MDRKSLNKVFKDIYPKKFHYAFVSDILCLAKSRPEGRTKVYKIIRLK